MKGVAAAVAVVAAVLLVASAAVAGHGHHKHAAGPVACYRRAGWAVRPGSTKRGGSASLAQYTYAGWLRIGNDPGPFLYDTSGNLTAAQLHVVTTCSPGVPVPDVAP